ncbi:major facilitator superfamily domain-containing protein [Chaetomium tenue]|uniref:Major facilitator superfamily domain-containing protein n=1 Tax=Chaetomium tenue TaxID=1854479 RepID=A0ACB7PPF8_9PEZI|nr:major facilitator superfamily domain-containing protein [Chaetomium globosum]
MPCCRPTPFNVSAGTPALGRSSQTMFVSAGRSNFPPLSVHMRATTAAIPWVMRNTPLTSTSPGPKFSNTASRAAAARNPVFRTPPPMLWRNLLIRRITAAEPTTAAPIGAPIPLEKDNVKTSAHAAISASVPADRPEATASHTRAPSICTSNPRLAVHSLILCSPASGITFPFAVSSKLTTFVGHAVHGNPPSPPPTPSSPPPSPSNSNLAPLSKSPTVKNNPFTSGLTATTVAPDNPATPPASLHTTWADASASTPNGRCAHRAPSAPSASWLAMVPDMTKAAASRAQMCAMWCSREAVVRSSLRMVSLRVAWVRAVSCRRVGVVVASAGGGVRHLVCLGKGGMGAILGDCLGAPGTVRIRSCVQGHWAMIVRPGGCDGGMACDYMYVSKLTRLWYGPRMTEYGSCDPLAQPPLGGFPSPRTQVRIRKKCKGVPGPRAGEIETCSSPRRQLLTPVLDHQCPPESIMSKPGSISGAETVNGDQELEQLTSLGLQRNSDGLICWLPDSKDHPRNWSAARKTFDTTVIIFLEFFVTVVSTAGTSAAHAAQPEYGGDKVTSILAFTFMYNLGQALGGLITPALSELIGRRTPYLVSCALFSIFSLLTGLVPHVSAVWLGRFAAGFTSAVPAVVTAGSIHDMFDGGQRVWLVFVWNAGSIAGLCVGPLYGACLLAVCGDWRWIFYVSAAVTAVCFGCLLGVRESRPSQVLKRKIEVLEAKGGVGSLEWFNPDDAPDARALLQLVVVQPLKLLGTEPIVIMVTVIGAVSSGIIYLFTESLPDVYLSMSAGFTPATASMVFLAFLPGIALGFLPRLWDQRAVRQALRRGERIQPEDKIMGFAVAAPALAIGLIWFSWTIPPAAPQVHWLVPTAALVLVGFAVNEMSYTLSAYLTDAYLLYAASAFCGLAFVRALVSGIMPLVANRMYPALGANIAGTVVACFALVFCLAPWVLFRYGRVLRQKSPFAKHSLESHLKSQIPSQKKLEGL